jgi:hypothetical protein
LEVSASDDEDPNDDSDSRLDELVEDPVAMASAKTVSPFFDVMFLRDLI